MGGKNRQKKAQSSFSIFNLFRSRKARKGDDHQCDLDHDCCAEISRSSKVWPSDEDKTHRWVAEPGIDRRAKDYIDKIYRNRVLESERQTFTIQPNGSNPNI